MNAIASPRWKMNSAISTIVRDIGGAREMRLEVGDSKVPDVLLPQSKISLWGNESNFSFRGDIQPDSQIVVEQGKVKHKSAAFDIEQYERPELSEDGGFEFEWVLAQKPADNKFRATIRTKGLTFHKQPHFSPEGIVDEEMRGGYVAYHDSASNNHSGKARILTVKDLTDEDLQWLNLDVKGRLANPRSIPALHKDYFTGQAFVIYRPKIIDANGQMVYGEIDIDTSTELMTVTVPWDFLDSAAYPIRVDPTFGYTTSGSSVSTGTTSAIANTHSSTIYTASTGDVLDTYSCILGTTATLTSVSMSVYDFSGGLPQTRQFAKTDITINTTGGTYTSAAVSQGLTNGVVYAPAIGRPSAGQNALRFNTIGGTERTIDNSFDLPATWTNAGTSTTRFSIYATYTAGGGGSGRIFKLAGPGGGLIGGYRGLAA